MARISSRDIPQADALDEVVRAVEAVGEGARTFEDIAAAIGKVERQGRYYRRAAEILGLIQNTPGANRSVLTASGREFLQNRAERDRILAEAVLRARLFQRVIPFLESAGERGVGREQLEHFIADVTQPVGRSMIPRRASTIVSWLIRIGMVVEHGNRYVLVRGLPEGISYVEYDAPDEPLSPRRYELETYNNVADSVRGARDYIHILVDEAARERAENGHRMLTNLVADKVRAAGAIPKANRYIDLSATLDATRFLFEMKSTTAANVHAQIRRGISQLYEYRYLQQLADAKLVLVIQNPPPQEKRWVVNYVVRDRGLLIAWDGDGRTLSCPNEISSDLRFLVQ